MQLQCNQYGAAFYIECTHCTYFIAFSQMDPIETATAAVFFRSRNANCLNFHRIWVIILRDVWSHIIIFGSHFIRMQDTQLLHSETLLTLWRNQVKNVLAVGLYMYIAVNNTTTPTSSRYKCYA